jgi:hypothetical protein
MPDTRDFGRSRSRAHRGSCTSRAPARWDGCFAESGESALGRKSAARMFAGGLVFFTNEIRT